MAAATHLWDGRPLGELLDAFPDVSVCQDVPGAILCSCKHHHRHAHPMWTVVHSTRSRVANTACEMHQGTVILEELLPYASRILQAMLLKPHCGASGIPCAKHVAIKN